ncbi:MAG: hypothetical protein KF873_07695 [Gemmataceae bacterium]|nr:hypothetical protein [Planctomycetia bacterium]MBX3398605.1 hypothetical protein [Gemmataceae bacterium]
MTIPILVEPAAAGFRAETGGPLNLSAVGPSSGEAVASLQELIAARLSNGATIIDLPMPQKPPLVPELPLSENPLWPDFLAAVEEYRNRQDAEDRAAYADEN